MSPVTHFLTGWAAANCAKLDRRERAIVTLACVVPDLDGVGIIPELLTRSSSHPLLWFTLYHHSLHSLAFAVVVATVAFVFADRRWKTALLALLTFHIHLLEDVLGSRGPDGFQWPIPYFSPFASKLQITWSGQWALNAWPNVAITAMLLVITIRLAWRRGYSPLEMFSLRADAAFISVLHKRFSAHAGTSAEG